MTNAVKIQRVVLHHKTGFLCSFVLTLFDGVIEKLKDTEDNNGSVNIASIMKLAVGEKIQITMGAFVNQIGKFESLCADGRVSVLLELLGRPIAVRLPASAVYACA